MKTRKYIIRQFRKGSLLAFILVIGICLALLGLGMLQLGFGSRVNSALSTYVIDARIAADAGLNAAIYQLNLNYKFGSAIQIPDNPVSLDNSNGKYIYSINPISSYNYRIDSTGTSVRKTRNVHALTKRESIFDYALFVTNDMTINNKTLIDGYNSDDGPYNPEGTNSGLTVEIGSNTTQPRQGAGDDGIFLVADVEITGNVAVGPGVSEDNYWTQSGGDKGVIDGKPDSLAGSAYSLLEPFTWGNILEKMPVAYNYVHTLEGQLADVVIESGGYLTLGNSEIIIDPEGTEIDRLTPYTTIMCKDLDIEAGGVLEIYGDGIVQPDPLDPNIPVVLYVTGDLNMKQGAQILLTTGNCLQIFVGGQFKSPAEGCLLTNQTFLENPKPKYFELYGISEVEQAWTLGNTDTFYGVIYAPNANITVHNSGEIFGSIASRSIIINNSGQIHYDLTLAEEAKYFAGYIINRWWEEAD